MKLNKVDFTIISSGALVIREIISDARNLDIAVTKEGHNKLNKNYNLKEKGNGFYTVNDKIECIIDDKKIQENLLMVIMYKKYLTI